ncbi:type I pullulanase [Prevotella sp. KH2C16]|uniref:type I pullulanase n=1 Tax=Prevotella sp. KH2C16 TaxID=1855325 RepID=UPI00351039CF
MRILSISILMTMVSLLGHAQSMDTMAVDYTWQVDYTFKGTDFFLCAPNKGKHRPLLRLYRYGLGGKPIRTVKMNQMEDNGWMANVKGDLKGLFYTFDVVGDRKHWVETPGIFAKAVGVNGNRGAIIDMAETNPEGWESDRRPELKSPSDLVIYEMHHRDFSIDASSGIVHKGKFLALTEPKAIAHLQDLGINAVHILPSYDFGSIDESRLDQPQYNWGYDPVNYDVPEGSYSTNPYDPSTRIREFKQMVQALHKAGIRVILDVVYNHTYDITHSNFQRTWPDYFYRKKADGTYSNGSGCGNETASEQPMMREFMIESVKYWATEYHIDGFRFDLMGVHDIETMNQIRAELDSIDPSIFIYGEGWSAGSCAYPAEKLATKANISRMPRIAAFSDDIRDALRGPFSDDHKGAFLAGIAGEEESLKAGIAGMIAHPQVDYNKVNYSKKPWAAEPTQMISYVSCHDDMCLVDRLRTEMPQITTEELIRLDLLAQTAVFTSQGVPFLLAGEEMLRDKKGVHNSYNSPDEINRLDWQNLARYPQVFAYYKNLIRLRKNHKAFRMGDAETVRRHLHFLPTEPCLVGFYIDGREVGDSWNRIVVILNSSKESREVAIPEGSYTVVCCDGVIDETGNEKIEGGKVVVDPQSALIIHN